MTAIQLKYGPFAKETDQEWLAAVLVQAGQKTVRVAAARRLKKLTFQKAVSNSCLKASGDCNAALFHPADNAGGAHGKQSKIYEQES